jgi:hypothetical protein
MILNEYFVVLSNHFIVVDNYITHRSSPSLGIGFVAQYKTTPVLGALYIYRECVTPDIAHGGHHRIHLEPPVLQSFSQEHRHGKPNM